MESSSKTPSLESTLKPFCTAGRFVHHRLAGVYIESVRQDEHRRHCFGGLYCCQWSTRGKIDQGSRLLRGFGPFVFGVVLIGVLNVWYKAPKFFSSCGATYATLDVPVRLLMAHLLFSFLSVNVRCKILWFSTNCGLSALTLYCSIFHVTCWNSNMLLAFYCRRSFYGWTAIFQRTVLPRYFSAIDVVSSPFCINFVTVLVYWSKTVGCRCHKMYV